MKRIRRAVVVGLAPVLLLAALASFMAPPAFASIKYAYHVYCYVEMGPFEACPPHESYEGGATYEHLESNLGNSQGEHKAVCVDAYLVNSGYTGESCEYTEKHDAEEYYAGEYGYPRAWNAGQVTHLVWAQQYGYTG
ncbi:MAG: hypothetical protein ACYCUM_12305 [Solirubrobacteraceae bacterium]